MGWFPARLAFRRDKKVLLQSKAGQSLHRYFPELVEALAELPQSRFVLDGEIVIYVEKQISFDNLPHAHSSRGQQNPQVIIRNSSNLLVLRLAGRRSGTGFE